MSEIFGGEVSEIFRGGVSEIFGGVSEILGGSEIFGGGCLQIFFSFFFQFLFPQKNPSGMHIPPPRRSMRGRYASHWNAFLLE